MHNSDYEEGVQTCTTLDYDEGVQTCTTLTMRRVYKHAQL